MLYSRVFLVLALIMLSISGLFSQATLGIDQPRISNNLSPASIDEMIVRVIPQGSYFENRTYIKFSPRGSKYKNPNDSLEVVFDFTLPEGSFINDSWLWFGDIIVKAKVIDRWTAGLIYQTSVGSSSFRRDPSLLVKNNQTNYEMRVYPVQPDSFRRVKMNIFTPTVWDSNMVRTTTPLSFLKASSQVVKRVRVIAYTNAEFNNPRFIKDSTIKFRVVDDPEFGTCYAADIEIPQE